MKVASSTSPAQMLFVTRRGLGFVTLAGMKRPSERKPRPAAWWSDPEHAALHDGGLPALLALESNASPIRGGFIPYETGPSFEGFTQGGSEPGGQAAEASG